MKKTKKDLEGKGPYVDLQSEASKQRTSSALSQDEVEVPPTGREDLPEADRAHFRHGKYSGTGTGAAPGSTDTGGAEINASDTHPRMGTTDGTQGDPVPGGAIERSSAATDYEARLDQDNKGPRTDR